ncbi:MAG: hypothetical protein DRJ45_04900, partial [Thermoprotei archaeon]
MAETRNAGFPPIVSHIRFTIDSAEQFSIFSRALSVMMKVFGRLDPECFSGLTGLKIREVDEGRLSLALDKARMMVCRVNDDFITRLQVSVQGVLGRERRKRLAAYYTK